ncbi:tripartite tricarboxylate transporter TctB family protein [uncultured Roseobacter sp.]|uniref:tripartite tricarboxylate transporter TctB family protein n=1 Tax=uncultured Roseobacter sp. TaxID=114847 RepID=UPI002639C473|nr:tripartite tricarboxylate transporter TctB family protein [uncultured Roseobacter sp.]
MAPGSSPAPRTVGIALILLGIGATAASMGIALDQYGRWGARLFPLCASGVLILLGIVELQSGQKPPRPEHRHLTHIAALLVLALCYVWLMSRFGYLISTAVAAPAALWIFGIRNPVGLLAAAFMCPAAYHMIFFEMLGVFPPLGRWFDLLDVVGGY